ncbi:MAG: DUF2231 domain-containing protein [Rhodococcus sp. (in: high G+C Gram-positive bacteria)]|uniref:DUF2231 domain-containing protein n=1 Tax=Rhodococcus sp. TaxID=1831 RepID=UPI003BB06BCA
MNLEPLFGKTEDASFLDGGSSVLQQRIRASLGKSGTGPLLRGSWLGHPLHPVLVTVPIGTWVGATVFDLVLRDHVAARRLIGLGLVATPPTLMTGWADWAERNTRQRRVGQIHAGVNAAGISALAASFVRRRRGTDARAIAASVAGVVAVGLGGALGGHLTYAMGAGVDEAEKGPRGGSVLTSVG